MEKIIVWLSGVCCIVLTIFLVCASAAPGKSVILKLSFDQYATPHATFLINGHPVYAMIDTGSSFGFHLRESQLKNIKGLKKGRQYRSTDGKGEIQHNTAYLAKTLDVNGLTVTDITVTPFKQWGLMISGVGKLPEGPVAGLGAFKDKQILLDYVSGSLTISDGMNYQSLIKDTFTEFPFRMSSDGLVFDVEQSGHTYHLILDTGSTVSMVWRERLKSSEPASCLLVDPAMNNPGCEATLLEITSTDGQPAQFGAVVVAGDFKHMGNIDGLIGNNVLWERKILIDFKRRRLFISHALRKG